MNRKQRKILIIPLIVVICISMAGLSACGAYTSTVRGFTDSVFYMASVNNIDSYNRITIGAKDASRRVTYGEALNMGTEKLGNDVEICLEVLTKTYNGTTGLTVNWVGPKTTENVLTLICSDEDMYISTNVFKLLAEFADDIMPGSTGMFGEIYKYNWLKVNSSDTALLTGVDVEKNIDTTKATGNITAKFEKIIANSSNVALSNILSNAMTVNRGTYFFDLDAKTIAELSKQLAKAGSENVGGFEDLIDTVENELGLTKGVILKTLKVGSVRELIELLTAGIDKENIPNMNISASVKASGEGNGMRQEYTLNVTSTEDDETIAIRAEGYTEVNKKPIVVPGKDVGTVTDIMNAMMGGADFSSILDGIDLSGFDIEADALNDVINSFNWNDFNLDGLDLSGFNIN